VKAAAEFPWQSVSQASELPQSDGVQSETDDPVRPLGPRFDLKVKGKSCAKWLEFTRLHL
jgi:hypothetical protein